MQSHNNPVEALFEAVKDPELSPEIRLVRVRSAIARIKQEQEQKLSATSNITIQPENKPFAGINTQDEEGTTPLVWAIKGGYTDVAQELIKTGADLNVQNNDGDTALILAIDQDATTIAQELIKAGANLDIQGKGGDTALIAAAFKGDAAIIKELLQAGAKPDFQNTAGTTALHASIFAYVDTTIARELIKAGANLDIETNNGDTALTFSAFRGETAKTETLIKAGAKLNIQNKHGHTALTRAISWRKLSIVSLFLSHGAIPQDPKLLFSFLKSCDQTKSDVLIALQALCQQQKDLVDIARLSPSELREAETLCEHLVEPFTLSKTFKNFIHAEKPKVSDLKGGDVYICGTCDEKKNRLPLELTLLIKTKIPPSTIEQVIKLEAITHSQTQFFLSWFWANKGERLWLNFPLNMENILEIFLNADSRISAGNIFSIHSNDNAVTLKLKKVGKGSARFNFGVKSDNFKIVRVPDNNEEKQKPNKISPTSPPVASKQEQPTNKHVVPKEFKEFIHAEEPESTSQNIGEVYLCGDCSDDILPLQLKLLIKIDAETVIKQPITLLANPQGGITLQWFVRYKLNKLELTLPLDMQKIVSDIMVTDSLIPARAYTFMLPKNQTVPTSAPTSTTNEPVSPTKKFH